MKPHKHCELVKAWADGAEIEERSIYHDSHCWTRNDNPNWNNDQFEFRIKPKRKRYRVARMTESGFGIAVVASKNEAKRLETFREFICWLTDWIEYD